MSQSYNVSIINCTYLLTSLDDLKIIMPDNCSYNMTETQSTSDSLITVLRYTHVHNVHKCIQTAGIFQ